MIYLSVPYKLSNQLVSFMISFIVMVLYVRVLAVKSLLILIIFNYFCSICNGLFVRKLDIIHISNAETTRTTTQNWGRLHGSINRIKYILKCIFLNTIYIFVWNNSDKKLNDTVRLRKNTLCEVKAHTFVYLIIFEYFQEFHNWFWWTK
jgi:hypothetical protein